jgi:hypothetical protein
LLNLLATGENNYQKKILLPSWVVKGKIAFGNSLGFQTQIADLPLAWKMLIMY